MSQSFSNLERYRQIEESDLYPGEIHPVIEARDHEGGIIEVYGMDPSFLNILDNIINLGITGNNHLIVYSEDQNSGRQNLGIIPEDEQPTMEELLEDSEYSTEVASTKADAYIEMNSGI